MKAEVVKMDELEFRRAVYADPWSTNDKVKNAAAEDESKQQFWDELKALDSKIQQAVKVDVPEGLAHKLILRQSLHQHQVVKRQRNRVYLALAASTILTVGLTFSLFNRGGVDIGEHALAHFYHAENYESAFNESVALDSINAKLASFGSELTDDIGEVMFANYCDFNNMRTLHLVMQGEQGKVSVFLLPHEEKFQLRESFADDRMHGTAVNYGGTDMIIIGEKGERLDELKTRIGSKLNQSA